MHNVCVTPIRSHTVAINSKINRWARICLQCHQEVLLILLTKTVRIRLGSIDQACRVIQVLFLSMYSTKKLPTTTFQIPATPVKLDISVKSSGCRRWCSVLAIVVQRVVSNVTSSPITIQLVITSGQVYSPPMSSRHRAPKYILLLQQHRHVSQTILHRTRMNELQFQIASRSVVH
jgi:hypothetical protein